MEEWTPKKKEDAPKEKRKPKPNDFVDDMIVDYEKAKGRIQEKIDYLKDMKS